MVPLIPVAFGVFACASAAVAQHAPAAPSIRWQVRESATIDLWYHGLATIGYEELGPLPYYAPGYAADMRRAKDARGIAETPLERDASSLRFAFRHDSAFEVLHFLPLYFASTEPAAFLRIVHGLAEGTPIGALPPAQRAGVEALRGVLGSAAERRAVGRLASDLDVEWRLFYADWLTSSAAARSEAIAVLQHRWDARLAPALSGALVSIGLAQGTIYVVPALGPEGRVVADVPAGGAPLVAVWWPPYQMTGDAPLLAAVRELCFPVVGRLPIAETMHGDRVAAGAESARAAVRCGAELLESTTPALAPAYRETFRRAASAGARRSFAESYRLTPATERALAAEVGQLLAARGGGQH